MRDEYETHCPFCLSPTHAMALEVGPDALCYESIRSAGGMRWFAPVVSSYFLWRSGSLPFSALLLAAQPRSSGTSPAEGASPLH